MKSLGDQRSDGGHWPSVKTGFTPIKCYIFGYTAHILYVSKMFFIIHEFLQWPIVNKFAGSLDYALGANCKF